jgi:hypothetical protein
VLERCSLCGISVAVASVGSICRWPSDLQTSVEFGLVNMMSNLTDIVFLSRLGLSVINLLNSSFVAKINDNLLAKTKPS